LAAPSADLITGAEHPDDFSKDGICYALVIMWLRMKFEKKADSDFYAWLFADDVRTRNSKMSKWMQKQLFALDIANPELQKSYAPEKDEDGAKKRVEAAHLLVDSMLKYQRKLKNEDQFVLVSFCKHVVGVFFSRSPWTGNGVISFFDPNFGVWRFESSSRDERCTNFKRFFAVHTFLYKEMDSLSIKILTRH
jgi:hypothetical protein